MYLLRLRYFDGSAVIPRYDLFSVYATPEAAGLLYDAVTAVGPDPPAAYRAAVDQAAGFVGRQDLATHSLGLRRFLAAHRLLSLFVYVVYQKLPRSDTFRWVEYQRTSVIDGDDLICPTAQIPPDWDGLTVFTTMALLCAG